MVMDDVVDVSNIVIRPIAKQIGKEMIEKYHYTHNMNSSRYALGVFIKETDENSFFEGEIETLIGTILYAHPVSNRAIDSICGDGVLKLNEVLELIRLFIHDGYGKNIESYVIGQSFKWLKENDPNVKVLISYADPEASHTGGIYRATNWLYQGCGVSKLMPDYSLQLEENGPWMHSRTVGSKFGNKRIESLAQAIGHTFWRKEESAKHRYIYFLCNRTEKKRLLKLLKLPVLSYSEIKPYTQLIQKINVKNGIVESIETIQGEGDGGWTNKQYKVHC